MNSPIRVFKCSFSLFVTVFERRAKFCCEGGGSLADLARRRCGGGRSGSLALGRVRVDAPAVTTWLHALPASVGLRLAVAPAHTTGWGWQGNAGPVMGRARRLPRRVGARPSLQHLPDTPSSTTAPVPRRTTSPRRSKIPTFARAPSVQFGVLQSPEGAMLPRRRGFARRLRDGEPRPAGWRRARS